MPANWVQIQTGNNISADTMLLLMDGSVFVHDAGGSQGGNQWMRLRPDSLGRYEHGVWSGPFTMRNKREFFASGVLCDGRVFVIGGEYSDDKHSGGGSGSDCPLGEVIDPAAKSPAWTQIKKPPEFQDVRGDVAACILEDGRVLLGFLTTAQTAIWDPSTGKWTEAGKAFGTQRNTTKDGCSNEETWTLLQDGTVLTVEINPVQMRNRTEKYLAGQDVWVSAGCVRQPLTLASVTDPTNNQAVEVNEIGPALALPNGSLFAIGATGHTAIYAPVPGNPSQAGTWRTGPDLPSDGNAQSLNSANGGILTAVDAPACLLPSGAVLVAAGTLIREIVNDGPPFWSNPTTLYICDPAQPGAAWTQLAPPAPNSWQDTWTARFLLLPTGQVLYSCQQPTLGLFTPDSVHTTPNPSWLPTITNCPASLTVGQTYTISGIQLNGLSQANSYGDDAQMATNYPIFRVTYSRSGTIAYLLTTKVSTFSIAPGLASTCSVTVPAGTPAGAGELVVIANGIPSAPVSIQVLPAGRIARAIARAATTLRFCAAWLLALARRRPSPG